MSDEVRNPQTVLEVNHLEIEFSTFAGTVHAVRDVSFSLKKGETLAIVGESGCGKSVTCRAIMGLLAKNASVTGGEIRFCGEDLLKKKKSQMRKLMGEEIAMIFQDPMTSLDPTMKIGKQIQEMILLHQKVSKQAAKKRVLELLQLVGIDQGEKRYHQYPHQFSGGQRQRIVIAIALACNPGILIADEPTTALDVTMQAQIIDLLKELQRKFGMSVIFITHDLGVVANVADRVAVMYAGKIIEYLLEIFKVIRAYGGSAVCATQDLVDFFALKGGKLGRGILNNSKTKIILNMENAEAEHIREELDLSEAEMNSIVHFERGTGLISTNNNNLIVEFKASQLEKDLITTDRRDLQELKRRIQKYGADAYGKRR